MKIKTSTSKVKPNGKCVGCAYLIFPKKGIDKESCVLSGVFLSDSTAINYSVKYEPVNLWEIRPKKLASPYGEGNGLTLEQHRYIVANLKSAFEREIGR